MPSSSRPIWLLTLLLLTAFPVLNLAYWPRVLQSGVLPRAGDSIAIPMYGSVVLAVVASPFLLGITWICVRRYNPAAKIMAFRRDRPYRTSLATLVCGGLAALLVEILREVSITQPWYEYIWPAYFALWVLWLMWLRAALIEQADVVPTGIPLSDF